MPTFTSHNAEINFQTFGQTSKPAIIFSNSLGTNFSMWQPQIDFLGESHFVICYDTRGHGASSTPQGPYTIDQLGQDIINLLDHLGIEKAVFCGISMGGLTGQWLAIHRPEHFSHVVISNTAAKIGQEQAWLDRAQLVREQGLASVASTAAGRWFTETFVQSKPDIVARLSNDLGASSPEGYASCCEALAKTDLRGEVQSISIPVLVIAGTQDPVTTVKDSQFMINNIRNSALFKINASHISNLEQPQAFTEAILDFIQ